MPATRSAVGIGQRKPAMVSGVGVLAVTGTVAGAGLALSGVAHAAVVAFVASQSLGLLWLSLIGWTRSRMWASVLVVVAAAWALTFLVPSWLYALDPDLLDVTAAPVETMALFNLSLFCLGVPVALMRGSREGDESEPRPIQVRTGEWAPGWLWAWTLVGLAGMALVFQGAGGVVEYVTNLDQEGRFNQGRVYLIWMALFTRYTAQIVLYRRWAEGRPAGLGPLALVVAAVGVTALLGARLFIATALVEIAIFYAVVRRPISGKVMLPVVLVVSCAVILVGGAAKRYADYQTANPGSTKAFGAYLREDAREELAEAYANNYADGVRLLALARATVPDYGGFERGKLLVRYAIQPIPRKWRPETSRSEPLRRALYPGGGYAHAIPLQTSAYVQAGPVGIALVFLVLGYGVAVLDRKLVRMRHASLTAVVLVTTTAVVLPTYLRASEAGGFALALIEVLGLGAVAFTADGGLRRVRSRLSDRASEGG